MNEVSLCSQVLMDVYSKLGACEGFLKVPSASVPVPGALYTGEPLVVLPAHVTAGLRSDMPRAQDAASEVYCTTIRGRWCFLPGIMWFTLGRWRLPQDVRPPSLRPLHRLVPSAAGGVPHHVHTAAGLPAAAPLPRPCEGRAQIVGG